MGLTCCAKLFAAETLIPIIRQSVPMPFPADVEQSKREELTQCTQQAVEAIQALQEAIDQVTRAFAPLARTRARALSLSVCVFTFIHQACE